MSEPIRVSTADTGLTSYPLFAAMSEGIFEAEGVQVSLQKHGNGLGPVQDLFSGSADVVLGGIWRPMIYRGRLGAMVSFAGMCARSSLVLVGREPRRGWPAKGATIVVPECAPSFWVVLHGALERQGVAASDLRFVAGLSLAEATALFHRGLGDFLFLNAPAAVAIAREGGPSIIWAMAEVLGDLPWSVFYARPQVLTDRREDFLRFTRGIQRVLNCTLSADPEQVVGIGSHCFPALAPDEVVRTVRACRDWGVWSSDARIDPVALTRWQELWVREGALEHVAAYNDLVDASFAGVEDPE
jgi:NitT/TauT family transport system substrate-binding protein